MVWIIAIALIVSLVAGNYIWRKVKDEMDDD